MLPAPAALSSGGLLLLGAALSGAQHPPQALAALASKHQDRAIFARHSIRLANRLAENVFLPR